eukprot:5197799-Amphidinium_carterae.1
MPSKVDTSTCVHIVEREGLDREGRLEVWQSIGDRAEGDKANISISFSSDSCGMLSKAFECQNDPSILQAMKIDCFDRSGSQSDTAQCKHTEDPPAEASEHLARSMQ